MAREDASHQTTVYANCRWLWFCKNHADGDIDGPGFFQAVR